MFKKGNKDLPRNQYGFYTLEDLVPQDHYLRDIDKYIDFDFIYDLVTPLYGSDTGRPGLDPVLLIKLPLLQYLEGIRSMRQTIKQIQVNTAYRWFLGLSLEDEVPHFSTFGKNYSRRFKDTELFEQIFYDILEQARRAELVDEAVVFIDGTHIKAHANSHKYENQEVANEALFYADKLKLEVREERERHEKKPLESLEQNDTELKNIKVSKTDPEAGWFRKGEHKHVFAYNAQVGCDKNGWILAFTAHPGNEHDSRAFKSLFDVLQAKYQIEMLVMDAGYKTPALAHLLITEGITPVFPYSRPKGKKAGLRKQDFEYDREFDGYTCPQGQWLNYSTTNKLGYHEYKSNPKICQSCPLLSDCSQSANKTKLITRHIWQDDLDGVEQVRRLGFFKSIYPLRKETIERSFGTGKEYHGLRYTNEIGLGQMEKKLALTFSCMNMKKLAKVLKNREKESLLFGLKKRELQLKSLFIMNTRKQSQILRLFVYSLEARIFRAFFMQ